MTLVTLNFWETHALNKDANVWFQQLDEHSCINIDTEGFWPQFWLLVHNINFAITQLKKKTHKKRGPSANLLRSCRK